MSARKRTQSSAKDKAQRGSRALELLEACLTCCICQVLHNRDLLPKKAFQIEAIDIPGTNETFEALSFEREASVRADSVCRWLDVASNYLKTGALSALQLCVHPDPYRRHNVLETYTFTFRYPEELPRPVNSTRSRSTTATEDNAERLRQSTKALASLCDSMLPLPNERYLTANLFLSEDGDCNHTNGDEEFVTMRHDRSQWPETATHMKQSETFDAWLSDDYSLRLCISYLAPKKSSRKNAAAAEYRLADFKKTIAPDEDVDSAFLMNVAAAAPPSKVKPSRRAASQQSLGGGASSIAGALDAMLRPHPVTQGDTQLISSIAASESQAHQKPVQLRYQYDRLHHNRNGARERQAKLLAQEIGGKTKSGQTILCICSDSQEEGDMIPCTVCKTWQHLHCFGYVGRDDPRLPNEHICYMCFVNPRDDDTLKALIQLALERRVMFRALRHGVVGKTHLADAVGMNPGIAYPIFQHLKDKGWIVAASGSHKAGFKTSGNPAWVGAHGIKYANMLDELFDPTTAVEDYFQLNRSKPSDSASQLTIAPATALPAPVLPVSERRKRTSDAPRIAQPEDDDQKSLVNSGMGSDEDEYWDSGSHSNQAHRRGKRTKLEVVKQELKSLQSEDMIDARVRGDPVNGHLCIPHEGA